MPTPACLTCGANLSTPGAVIYSESYSAHIDGAGDTRVLVADAFSVESEAKCVACGARLEFRAVDLSSGGFT